MSHENFNTLFESILDDYEGDHSSQALKAIKPIESIFNPSEYDARTDMFCGIMNLNIENIKDYIDVCRYISEKFSWEHNDIIFTTSSQEFADSTDYVIYDPNCGKTFNNKDTFRVSVEYNIPDKLTVENLMNMMLFFTKIDDLMRIVLERAPIYNVYYKMKSEDGWYWKYNCRPDAIKLFNLILFPTYGVTRNGNDTESTINEVSKAIIYMCSMKVSARNTVPLLRAIFKKRNLLMKERAESKLNKNI